MKLEISDNCIGCGTCQSICPNVFKVEDEQKAQVLVDNVTDNDYEGVLSAMESCPVAAIYED